MQFLEGHLLRQFNVPRLEDLHLKIAVHCGAAACALR